MQADGHWVRPRCFQVDSIGNNLTSNRAGGEHPNRTNPAENAGPAAATAASYFNTPSTTPDAATRPSAMTLARHKNCCRALRLS
jgi:hypothetical protein